MAKIHETSGPPAGAIAPRTTIDTPREPLAAAPSEFARRRSTVDQFAGGGPSHYTSGLETESAGGVCAALALGAIPSVRLGPTISLSKVQDLLLTAPTASGRPAHLAAASGLAKCGDHLIVAPDDENHIGVFAADTKGPGTLVRVFEGVLPDEHHARKAAKPDLEALTFVDAAVSGSPHGAVLALGSGSTKARRRAVLVPLDASGRPSGAVTTVDLAPLYKALAKQFGELNVEGATVCGDKLRLLQRGNGAEGINAVVDLDLDLVGRALTRGRSLSELMISNVRRVDLGVLNDVPLTFTDATSLADGRVVFTASAEATDNVYDDGEVVGSAVGILDVNGCLERLSPFDRVVKIEGVEATLRKNGDIDLLLVTDGDDATRPGELFSATWLATGKVD